MLLLQQQNHARGLRVERAGHVQDGIADNGLDGVIGDGALSLEAVDGAASLDGLEEGGSSGVLELDHCDLRC